MFLLNHIPCSCLLSNYLSLHSINNEREILKLKQESKTQRLHSRYLYLNHKEMDYKNVLFYIEDYIKDYIKV